ncbi:protein of unknown function [Rhodoferax sp. OV413]|uniref:DUF802 domain-containing protein n=1 Tax=Rhodoferax sp. OV413 TaxID=1855285 RepID=UPI00088656BD|nr:DUF802 domain-containing protein [Rhodoferax sp. OV413]SDO70645.1 protein of unknown function [Rhodoferax sp. OV413]
MNRFVFAATFAIGLLSVAWVGYGFVGTSALALAVTGVIAGVYLLGALELRRYRSDTASLSTALAELEQPPADLPTWLERVPALLRNPVRMRVEGERSALPGLALTPYLVGLLVMLGMLGTFLGMVVTFKGAVFALEGSTDLHAIRAALAAPIKGLGLSFGTSVAGVAASAVLGLLSAMARRERLDVVRLLDARIATTLRPFSMAQQRQDTFKAVQLQAHALPEVAERLQALMDGIERRSQQLSEQLQGQQAQFHREVSGAYGELASSVSASLQASLTAAARAAGDSIQPVVQAAMAEMAQESTRLHQRVFEATQSQLHGLAQSWDAAAVRTSEGWATAQHNHVRSSEAQVARFDAALQGFAETFEHRSSTLLASVQAAAAQSREQQAAADQLHLQGWTQALQSTTNTLQDEWRAMGEQALAQQKAVCQTLEKTAGEMVEHTSQRAETTLTQVADLVVRSEALLAAHATAEARWTQEQGDRLEQLADLSHTTLQGFADTFEHRSSTLLASVQAAASQSREEQATADQLHLQGWTQALQSTTHTLQSECRAIGEQALAQQQAVCQTLEKTAGEMVEHTSRRAETTLTQVADLVGRSEALLASHSEAEARWTQQQGERLDQLAGLWRTELTALRAEESDRGQVAVDRLAQLQAAVVTHLATLGTALEEPMARLMATAAEAPQAAAEVIAQLRQQMAGFSERDNQAFAERTQLVAQLDTLLQTLNQAAGDQSTAIESLVASAASVLDAAGGQFAQAVEAHTSQTAQVAAQVTGSAVELASLGEAFGHGVQLFSASNEKLANSLQRVEGAIQQSAARSDEQLAYYVAQAREVIDLSIAAQQTVVEDMRRLRSAEGVAG